jgi:hypothetical protein
MFRPETQPADNTRVALTDNIAPAKEKPAPLATLQNAKFVPPKSDLDFNDTCPVQVSVQYRAPSLQTRITFKLFCNYQGKKQDLSCKVDANERDGVAKAELRLFYPDGYKDGTVEYFFTAEHCRGDKVVESDRMKLPMCAKKIMRGYKGPIVEEINIRLAGFGGGVPTDKFDESTEEKVKHFQKDYMKMDVPTGIVDDDTAAKIDDFGSKYAIALELFSGLKCSCPEHCGGFGKGRHKTEYFEKTGRNGKPKPHDESTHRYEYPGMHRFLLWGIRGMNFHLTQEASVEAKLEFFSSGYRCNDHPLTKSRKTVNHLGKAADIHFKMKSGEHWITPKTDTDNNALCEKVRKACLKQNILNAQMEWALPNRVSLESTVDGAKTWVHADVRNFESKYLEDRFFCKSIQELDGKPISNLLKDAP